MFDLGTFDQVTFDTRTETGQPAVVFGILSAAETPDSAGFVGGVVSPGITGTLNATERADRAMLWTFTEGPIGTLNLGTPVFVARSYW